MISKNISLLILIAVQIIAGCVSTEITYETKSVPDKETAIASDSVSTFMQDGGWCWYQDPRAIINNGKLIVAGLSGTTGDVKVSIYDLKNEKNLGTVILHEQFQQDDHDVPALYARPDGSILAVWAKHGREKIHHYSISSPTNYLKWGPRKQFEHVYEDTRGVTYMNLYIMEDEGLLYNFFRDGSTYNPSFITSFDHGETWGNRTHLIADEVDGRNRPYARYLQRDPNTVGISFTDAHPRNYGNSLYYADFHDGAFYNVDGSKIKNLSDGPLLTSETEKIFTGSETKDKPEGFESVPNSAWTCATAKDSENHPHIGYTLYLSDIDHRFRIASWNGKRWVDREIAFAGKCLYQKESSYTGLMAFDPENPQRVIISTDVNPSTGEDLGGMHEVYTARISESDDITTIDWQPVTAESDFRNIRPVVVSNEGYKVALWLNGPWNTYKEYSSDIVGTVFEKPKKPSGKLYPELQNPMSVEYLQKHLSTAHPRLALTPEIEIELKKDLKSDPVVKNIYAAIKLDASKVHQQKLLERKMIGRRLLHTSREMLRRMNVLGMVYRMEKDQKALQRINEELLAVSNFTDWNPSHFLDVGEMSLAVALALDWTHGDLPESTVAMAKQALIGKGLNPSWKNPNGRGGRTYAENNWNQVCNGGLVAAAIAIAEDDPELAAKTIWRALDGLPVALRHYGPDGSHHEGSSYWNYATVFTAAISSMLNSSFGQDFGIWDYPGIAESGMYRVVMTAPSGWYYNYGDCGNKRSENGDLTLAWFAANTGNRTYLESDRFLRPPEEMKTLDRLAGLGLVWLSQFEEQYESNIPDVWSARGINPVAIITGGNSDPHGYYLGAKGGDGSVNHGNMDGGSFIFELNGVRWAIDLGKQDYNTIEQTGFNLWGKTQDAERWKLLSKNNFGHSTLTVNGQQHVVDGKTELVEFREGPNPQVIFDMTPAFGNLLSSSIRTFVKDSPVSITIKDEIETSPETTQIVWQMTTVADVEAVPGGAILRQDGKALRLTCQSHPSITVSNVSLDPPPMELDSRIDNLKRIEISIPLPAQSADSIEFVIRLADAS